MDGKVFSNETKKKVVKAIYEALKLPFYLKPIVRPITRTLINIIDERGDKFIPDEFDAGINLSLSLAFEGRYEDAAATAGGIMDAHLDIKYLPDEVEALLFVDGARLFVRFILNWIQNMKKNKTS